MTDMTDKPDWWPTNPYDVDLYTKERSWQWANKIWQLAAEVIWTSMQEHLEEMQEPACNCIAGGDRVGYQHNSSCPLFPPKCSRCGQHWQHNCCTCSKNDPAYGWHHEDDCLLKPIGEMTVEDVDEIDRH